MRRLVRLTAAVIALLAVQDLARAEAEESSSFGCGFCDVLCYPEQYGLAYCSSIGCGVADGFACETEHPGCSMPGEQFNRCTGNADE